MEQISLCITTFNRLDFTLRSFSKVVNDNRIGEILIVDDCSDMDIYLSIVAAVADVPKVKVIRNEENIGCYQNKYKAISLAKHKWCIILDSDNQIDIEYMDRLFGYQWMPKVIIAPDYAMPMFDYTSLSGVVILKENVARYANDKCFSAAINTMNYFVNRDRFCEVFDKETKRYADDSAYINYVWLMNEGKIFFAPFLRYFHEVHNGSHYVQYATESQSRLNELLEQFKIMQ